MKRHLTVAALIAALLVPSSSASAVVHPSEDTPTLRMRVSVLKEMQHKERQRRRQHHLKVHAIRTYERKTVEVGVAPTGTFSGSLPRGYSSTLLKYHSTVLAAPAMDAYFEACQRVGHYIGGSGYRSHAAQVSLYSQKPGLAAPPGTSYHEVGLALDVFNVSAEEQAALFATGWRRVRADEPWHYSWKVMG